MFSPWKEGIKSYTLMWGFILVCTWGRSLRHSPICFKAYQNPAPSDNLHGPSSRNAPGQTKIRSSCKKFARRPAQWRGENLQDQRPIIASRPLAPKDDQKMFWWMPFIKSWSMWKPLVWRNGTANRSKKECIESHAQFSPQYYLIWKVFFGTMRSDIKWESFSIKLVFQTIGHPHPFWQPVNLAN